MITCATMAGRSSCAAFQDRQSARMIYLVCSATDGSDVTEPSLHKLAWRAERAHTVRQLDDRVSLMCPLCISASLPKDVNDGGALERASSVRCLQRSAAGSRCLNAASACRTAHRVTSGGQGEGSDGKRDGVEKMACRIALPRSKTETKSKPL
jgi:hypothetical protein